MPDDHDFQPEITVLYCGETITPGTRIPEGWRDSDSGRARYVRIPCSSKIEPLNIIKLFESGADGVLLVACPHQQCQCLFGNAGAAQRVRYTQRLLDEVGIGGARLTIASQSDLSSDDIKALARELAASVSKLGPSLIKNPVAVK